MEFPLILVAEATNRPTIRFVWEEASTVGIVIIVILVLFSMCAWGVMAYKALQMTRARKFNNFFENEFRAQGTVTAMYERRVEVEGCPMFIRMVVWLWTSG